MNLRKFALILVGVLFSYPLVADEGITREQVRAVMASVDAAAGEQDTGGIGAYLSEAFYRYIEVPSDEDYMAATARIDKQQYLEQIDAGWETVENYSYLRKDVVINIARDGLTAESNSTIIETMRVNGQDMVSKVREYASYELEDGKLMIVTVESYPLVGDTTPK